MSETMNQESIIIPQKKALTLSSENIFKPSFNLKIGGSQINVVDIKNEESKEENKDQKEIQSSVNIDTSKSLFNVNAPAFKPTFQPILNPSVQQDSNKPKKKKKNKNKQDNINHPDSVATDQNIEEQSNDQKKEILQNVIVKNEVQNQETKQNNVFQNKPQQKRYQVKNSNKEQEKLEDNKNTEINKNQTQSIQTSIQQDEKSQLQKNQKAQNIQKSQNILNPEEQNQNSKQQNQHEEKKRKRSVSKKVKKNGDQIADQNDQKQQYKIVNRGRVNDGDQKYQANDESLKKRNTNNEKSQKRNQRAVSRGPQAQQVLQQQINQFIPVQQVFQPKVVDSLQAYRPPFKVKDKQVNLNKEQGSANENIKINIQDKVLNNKIYTLEFIFSLRQQNKQRPPNMAELDFPHKKRGANMNGFRKKPLTEKDKFNKMVGEIRILLNKLSINNFETISNQLLTKFNYTPSLLYELMKMIFIKSTTEHAYLDVYVRLCAILFKKFQDKENYEMNFKKLLVSKCQKQFFKMLSHERQERKIRKNSMNIEELDENQDQKTGQQQASDKQKEEEKDDEFSKPMMYLYDDEELKERKKEQMYGNMYLITELFTFKQLNGNIIKTCLEDLLQEQNDQNVEILCYMVNKLMIYLCKQTKIETENKVQENEKPVSTKYKDINFEYCDKICQNLIKQRNNKDLQARIRFKIQDLIDAYNKDWRYVIAQQKSKQSDNEGFKKIYVPKDQILTEQQVFHNGSSRTNREEKKNGHSKGKKFIYRAKSLAANEASNENNETDQKQQSKKGAGMQSLLQGLKAEDSEVYKKTFGQNGDTEEDEDEDASKLLQRRMSLNKFNDVGRNFQKYQDDKPAAGVRREILNMFNEFKESSDRQHAQEELIQICKQYSIEKFQFVGYFLNNSLSEKPDDFRQYMGLIFDYFYADQKLLEDKQIIESINVCVANLPDLIIDYPKAKQYAGEMLDQAVKYNILQTEMAEKYKTHIENLDS